MEEERFDQLFEEKTTQHARLEPGDRIEAVIVGISGENVFLDVGGKSEGVLAAAELRGEDGELAKGEGDRVEVYFLSSRGGESVFTTRLGGGASARELEEAFQAGVPVEGTVTAEVKGGFSVTIAGQRCFCPYSQMDVRRVESAADYIGTTRAFRITEYGNRGRNILVSARAVLEEERAFKREQLEKELQVGMQVSGTVSSIPDFGAFVDLGGVDGLIPIGELAWGQTTRVDDVLERGQQVQVVIKALDWERDRISLSLRETMPNPWDQAAERYPAGSVHMGTVARLAPYGAFITLEPGIDGMAHISTLGGGRKLNHAKDALEVGQEISVRVEAVDTAQKRISLAPEDYQRKEKPEKGGKPERGGRDKREREDRDEGDYRMPPSQPASMGTLGDLLAKAQEKRGKK